MDEDQKDAWKMVDELLADESDSMTGWEVDFIDGLGERRLMRLSDKQIVIIERIWDKVLG